MEPYIILLRLAGVSCPHSDLAAFFECNIWTLDQYHSGLCLPPDDDIVAFVRSTCLISDRSPYAWDRLQKHISMLRSLWEARDRQPAVSMKLLAASAYVVSARLLRLNSDSSPRTEQLPDMPSASLEELELMLTYLARYVFW